MMDNIYRQRREKLECEDGSLFLLFAESDSQILFQQNKNFFYFTGLEISEAVLIMKRLDGKFSSTLYIATVLPERIVWEGEKMSFTEAESISGIESVRDIADFERDLSGHLNGISNVFMDLNYPHLNTPQDKSLYWCSRIRDKYPQLNFCPVSPRINKLRMVKDISEIENLKKAIEITNKGISRVMRELKAGIYEYQAEAMLHYEMLNAGIRNWGFKPIVAAGKNAATLHYNKNNSKIGKEELLLLDVGVLYHNYSADISRVIPVGKKFTARQREIYNEVLQVQKDVINIVEPGINIKDLNARTVELISEALIRLKLIKKKEDYKKYYMHSVSHYLGMDAHDPFTVWGAILEPGNVITVEPGIYIPEEGIGVRIEDDILVTENGYENLSSAIVKEIDEIEAIRAAGVN